MKMLEIKDQNDLEASAYFKGKALYQPKNPHSQPDAIQNGDLELIIVPGLAFSANGDRLGRGKGYYDTFFAELKEYYDERKIKFPDTIGIAFSVQRCETIPMTENDFKIDSVIFGDMI